MTGSVLVQSMVDTRTLTEHLIDLDAVIAGRDGGRYVALCGTDVLAASTKVYLTFLAKMMGW